MTTPCTISGAARCKCTKHDKMRKLWSDHAIYTTAYIEAVMLHTVTKAVYRQRLLDNQTQLGHAMGSMFSKLGHEHGREFGQLLTEHIAAAEQAVLAVLHDSSDLKHKVDDVLKQGDRMSSRLGAMLHLSHDAVETLKREFRTHNQHVVHIAIVLHRFATRGAELVPARDTYMNHMLHVADILYKYCK